MSGELQFQTVRKHSLSAFLDSELYTESEILPITRHRAESYLKHPRSSVEDAILFLAVLDNRIKAYLGIFPDRIYFGEESFRAGWLSCMYVDPVLRGRGVARRFLELAFEEWDEAILVTNFTPAAWGLYQKTGRFTELLKGTGIRGYLRLNLSEIVPRKTGRQWSGIPMRIVDAIANLPLGIRAASSVANNPELTVEFGGKLNREENDFIQRLDAGSLERRSAEDINWMYEYPWVLQGKPDAEGRRYHFTSHVRSFETLLIRLRDSAGLRAVLHCTIRDGLLKVPHAWFEPPYAGSVLEALTALMVERSVHTLLTFHPALAESIRSGPHPFIHVREATRHMIISKKFAELLNTAPPGNFPDGAADGAFT